MHQKKVIVLLRSFSEEDLHTFGSFIRSPYFNTNKRLIELWEYLSKYAPGFDKPGLEIDKAHEVLFENKPFQEKRVDRLLHKLHKLADEFIAHQALRQNPEVGHTFLLTSLSSNNLHKHFEQEAKSFEVWLGNNRPVTFRFELARFFLEKVQSNHLHLQQQYSQGDVNLQRAMDALDHYYLIEKLMFATSMYNRQAVMPVEYSLSFIATIEEALRKDPEAYSPEVRLQYKAFLLAKTPTDSQCYYDLKEALFGHIDLLHEEDGAPLFFMLQNALGRAIGQQHPGYYQELFELYELQIKKGWILENHKKIRGNLFKNIVTVGTTLKKLNWTRDFIEENKQYLKSDEQDDSLNYALAMVCFEEDNYDEVLRLLAPLSRKNIFFDMSVRRLMLKVFFEQKDEDGLFTNINSYRVFLHRLEKINEYFKAANIAFLNILSALSRLYFAPADDEKLLKLKEEIHEQSSLPERLWLLAKIESLRK